MISKENFIALVASNHRFFNYVTKLYDMRIDMWENPMVTEYIFMFQNYLKEFFDEDEIEWIEWFCYDKKINPHLTAEDANGNVICNTVEELYDYLMSNKTNGELHTEESH
jgi:hypothetical protein